MKKFFYQTRLIWIGIIFDLLLSGFTGTAYGYSTFIITPLFSVMGVVLSTLNKPLRYKVITGILFGLFLEAQYLNTNLILISSLLLTILIIHPFTSMVSDHFIEKGILLFVSCGLYLLLIFTLGTILGNTDHSFTSFLTYEFIISVILNVISIIVMLFIESITTPAQRRHLSKNEYTRPWLD